MKQKPILMILPQLPPAVCGVGDYVTRLLTQWNEPERFRFVLLRGLQETLQLHPDLQAVQVKPEAESLFRVLRANADCDVFVQYIPFGLHRKGCPLWLVDALSRWREKEGKQSKLVVMFHELWSIQPWWKPQGFIQWRHRSGIARLLKMANEVFTNTDGYAGWISRLVREKSATVVPVGSNITPFNETDSFTTKREQGLYVLFGRQGTRIYAVKEFADGLKKLHQNNRLKKLVMLGGGGGEAMQRLEQEVLGNILPNAAFETSGYIEERGLSEYLSKAEYAVSCQTWSSVTKSTTFMAYAAHGVNVVSPYAGKDDRTPFQWLTSVDEVIAGGERMEKMAEVRSQALRQWYQENASWPLMVKKFSDAFELNEIG